MSHFLDALLGAVLDAVVEQVFVGETKVINRRIECRQGLLDAEEDTWGTIVPLQNFLQPIVDFEQSTL